MICALKGRENILPHLRCGVMEALLPEASHLTIFDSFAADPRIYLVLDPGIPFTSPHA